ncbi:hypothetical protein CBW65_07420 [Tumebacillus avium]|uniref:DUF1963 domain-containing protein n=1 Tax=Tumebacillus avium TaxID=1903704 RepID=A0A1Y0IKX6_9BACL|nr:hypothetical protein [Tumebacillus avium]ARU60930.1 hypothetical protein CBW65_07420 [Tumebacillus avium]
MLTEKCRLLLLEQGEETQVEIHTSFIGGIPHIPSDYELPICHLCGEQQTFYFQVAFPDSHLWAGRTMALFSCTSCAHKDYLIPEMLSGELTGADIPAGFLETYQKNFRILIYKTSSGTKRDDYKEKIKYKKINLVENADQYIDANKIGGCPNWILDDEAPATYNKDLDMFFLMQILEGATFEIVPGAPSQIVLGLSGEPEASNSGYYELFLGNNVYFFGTESKENKSVYIITQI